jgi:hypothetical protein
VIAAVSMVIAPAAPWKVASAPCCQVALKALGDAPVQLVLARFQTPLPPLMVPLPTPSPPSH